MLSKTPRVIAPNYAHEQKSNRNCQWSTANCQFEKMKNEYTIEVSHYFNNNNLALIMQGVEEPYAVMTVNLGALFDPTMAFIDTNNFPEVIKLIDFTNSSVCMKELLYVKVKKCTREDKEELFQIAQSFNAKIVDYGKDSILSVSRG